MEHHIAQTVRAEVSAQMRCLRDSINSDLVRDLEDLRKVITADVLAVVDKRFAELDKQMAASNDKQLIATKNLTKEMAIAACDQASKNAYKMVLKNINETLVPKINSVVEWVNYNTQDTGELVTEYRRAVELQSRHDDLKLLASAKGEDKRAWGPNASIRVMFGEDTIV